MDSEIIGRRDLLRGAGGLVAGSAIGLAGCLEGESLPDVDVVCVDGPTTCDVVDRKEVDWIDRKGEDRYGVAVTVHLDEPMSGVIGWAVYVDDRQIWSPTYMDDYFDHAWIEIDRTDVTEVRFALDVAPANERA